MPDTAPGASRLSIARPGWIAAPVLAGLLAACADVEIERERYRDDEAEQAEATRRNFQKLVEDYRTDYVARGAHAKAHSCLRAWFQVNRDIPDDYRYGVFSEPGRRYKIWVRFSNGHYDLATSQDYENDARGMALKLMDISGQPLERSDVDTATQDFLMANSPVFFAGNMPDYNFIVANPEDLKDFFFPGWNPLNWRIREMFAGRRVLSPPPASLLDPTYYSITPYKLGPHNIKFSARPCAERGAGEAPPPETAGEDFLKEQLREDLAETPACFLFQVQRQRTDRGSMSLDDATRAWSEALSPFVPVATITVPQQDFSAAEQYRFCENLSFAPWHALPEHRPVGELNRLRRYAYPASSGHRHARNRTAIPEALAYWCAAPGFDC